MNHQESAQCAGDYTRVRGDEGEIPYRGTITGDDSYGADLSEDATNRIRGISGMTQSDPVDQEMHGDG